VLQQCVVHSHCAQRDHFVGQRDEHPVVPDLLDGPDALQPSSGPADHFRWTLHVGRVQPDPEQLGRQVAGQRGLYGGHGLARSDVLLRDALDLGRAGRDGQHAVRLVHRSESVSAHQHHELELGARSQHHHGPHAQGTQGQVECDRHLLPVGLVRQCHVRRRHHQTQQFDSQFLHHSNHATVRSLSQSITVQIPQLRQKANSARSASETASRK